MPAQLPRLNLLNQRRKLVLNKQPINNQPVNKQPVNNQPVNKQPVNNQPVNNQPKKQVSVFGGGMVNRIAKTPAGCGCGGAR
jgi:hypothetical protein